MPTISCITTPTLEATNALMRHDDTRLILATGGGAMVKAAYSSGTPAIGVGAGNGPAYIHHTAGQFDHIYVSAGQRGLQIRIAPEDLIREARAEVADVIREI